MKRTSAIGMGLVWVGLTGCSGGAFHPIPYTSGASAYGDGDDGMGTDSDDGFGESGRPDGPPPPPGADGGGPPPPGEGRCCEANGTPGCDNKPVEQCVCEADEWCCTNEWDAACSALIEQLGCGHCAAGDGGDPPPPPEDGDCCSEHGTPGCDEPEVEQCVCDIEPFCCDNQWSAACTAVLEVHGCGECGAGSGEPPPGGDEGGEPPPGGDEGGAPPPGSDGDCCMANGSPGCDDGGVESCVCAQDSYCCNNEWDAQCAGEVESFGCGMCGGGDGGGGGSDTGGGSDDGGGGDDGGGSEISECCEQQPGAGCAGDPGVETCVCAMDAYCCNTFWDLTCAGEVELFGCGSCS